MKESIFETLEDEKGNIDFRRAGGMSKRNVLRQFEAILAREAKRLSTAEFSKQVFIRGGGRGEGRGGEGRRERKIKTNSLFVANEGPI